MGKRYFIARSKVYLVTERKKTSVYRVMVGDEAGPHETLGSFWCSGEAKAEPVDWHEYNWSREKKTWQTRSRTSWAWTILADLHNPEVANKHAEALGNSLSIPTQKALAISAEEILAAIIEERTEHGVGRIGIDWASIDDRPVTTCTLVKDNKNVLRSVVY